jgi:putative two-component system response regulator
MPQDFYQTARILIVDDEPSNVLLLEDLLEDWGYSQVKSTTDPYQALPLYQEFLPHIILLDLMMPGLDGFAVMQQLQGAVEDQPTGQIGPTVVVLTADVTPQTRRKALASGAHDFLTKPFDAIELSLRLSHLLEINFLHNQLRDQNQLLEERVAQRTQQLKESEHETVVCLSVAGEYRDDDIGRHTHRVAATAAVLARHSGLLNGRVDTIQQAALLHDVGKIGIPDNILLKPGRLTSEEFNIIKTHSQIGYKILSGHHTPLLQLAASIALSHHERWDGTGYPQGLSGDNIPVEGRIVAIADVFDALTHERPYKEAWPIDKAVAEIQAQAGRQFDPDLVQVFTKHLQDILDVRQE